MVGNSQFEDGQLGHCRHYNGIGKKSCKWAGGSHVIGSNSGVIGTRDGDVYEGGVVTGGHFLLRVQIGNLNVFAVGVPRMAPMKKHETNLDGFKCSFYREDVVGDLHKEKMTMTGRMISDSEARSSPSSLISFPIILISSNV